MKKLALVLCALSLAGCASADGTYPRSRALFYVGCGFYLPPFFNVQRQAPECVEWRRQLETK